MKPTPPRMPGNVLVRLSIWTIHHHDLLAAHLRFYVWSASATLLFLSLAGLVPLTISLYLLLFCALGIMILLWILIQWRRAILLAIDDAALKRTAHAAMLALIQKRATAGENMPRRRHRWLKGNRSAAK